MLSEEFETKMDLDSIEAISKPKIGSDSNGNRLKKCVRKGDIICFSKSENINMLPTNGNVSNLNKKVSLNATNNCSERILSGESLYKVCTNFTMYWILLNSMCIRIVPQQTAMGPLGMVWY